MDHKDRCDYRCMADGLLLEEARYNPNPELAVVLAERLEQQRLHNERMLEEQLDSWG